MRAQLELASERYKVARQVSHDIRSPLSALDVVLSSVSSLPEEQRILARLAINRIKDIANNLLLQNRQPVAGKDACKVNAMVDEPRSVQLLTS
jgi:signal transduction histidine kinase